MTTVKRVPLRPRRRPFEPGNPGRPSGARNKATQAIGQLAEGQAETLGEKVIELALGGNVACLRMLLDRVCPIRKSPPINVAMPQIESAYDLFAAMKAIWTAIGDGQLTADEAAALCVVVDRSIKAVELQDVVARVAALEEAQDKR
jgi:hypothetical protein